MYSTYVLHRTGSAQESDWICTRRRSYCVKDASGKVHQQGKIGATRWELDTWLKTLPQPWTAAMEATIFTGWIYNHLKPHAAAVKVAHPLMLRAIAASKKKNDQIDAGKLADCLRCDFLPECYMASTEIRERRRTLRYRHLLVRQVVQLADLITSCTLSFVSGENRFAPTTFQYVRPLLRSEANRIGGIGVKIHPESKYANLYHRLFGDQSYILHNVTYPLPLPGHPFPVSADRR